MQPIKVLSQWLAKHGGPGHYLFDPNDLRVLLPNLSDNAFKTLLSRAASSGVLHRVCRGLYVYEPGIPLDGFFLFHVAAKLRAGHFNYISLETVLSEASVISQMPTAWITLKSSGRSSIIHCGKFGTIEFVHTKRKPGDLADTLFYDDRCGMFRAPVPLALEDMKNTGRNLDLIDWNIANEYL